MDLLPSIVILLAALFATVEIVVTPRIRQRLITGLAGGPKLTPTNSAYYIRRWQTAGWSSCLPFAVVDDCYTPLMTNMVPIARWTREEARKIAGLFPERRFELIEGELIEKMGQNPPHAFLIKVLTSLLLKIYPGRIGVQSPIVLGPDTEPEPDLTVLTRDLDAFRHRLPEAVDVLLVIEVSDTTLAFDQGSKLELYARSGIPFYCVMDVQRNKLFWYCEPKDTNYRRTIIMEPGDIVYMPPKGPEISVAELFGLKVV